MHLVSCLTDDPNETNMSQSISDSVVDSVDDSNDQLFICCSFFRVATISVVSVFF